MPEKTIVFALITFLHDLFTAVWIGGLITLGLTVLPSVKKSLGKRAADKKTDGCHPETPQCVGLCERDRISVDRLVASQSFPIF